MTTKDILISYFKPTSNQFFERSMFCRSRQSDDVSILSYVTQLRKLVSTRGYEDPEDDNIRDQIMDEFTDPKLRKRLLEEQQLTLERNDERSSSEGRN